MDQDEARSIVTCDLEGRIETYNEGAERLFGYAPDEVIGRKRVSLFSPGEVVLGHVGKWLEAARREGAFRTRTVFVRKDGTSFAADIRITPTYKRSGKLKRHVGYCGMTKALSGVAPAQVMPRTSWVTRALAWIVITRAPFLTATLMPMLIAATWVGSLSSAEPFPWGLLASAFLGAASLHIAANTFNDYFDWRSGTDPANNDYFVPYSGGSRAIELGLVSERKLLSVAVIALFLAVPAVLPILLVRGPMLFVFGLVGAGFAYFYTAPPLRLAARRGLGELSVMLAFGPLLTAGTVYALTGIVEAKTFVIGIPIGLLAGAILWVNEFPDAEADARTGKKHLLATIGRSPGRWIYAMLIGAAFISTGLLTWAGTYPANAVAVVLALPLAALAIQLVFKHYLNRELVKACKATIQLHALFGCLLAAGFVWNVL